MNQADILKLAAPRFSDAELLAICSEWFYYSVDSISCLKMKKDRTIGSHFGRTYKAGDDVGGINGDGYYAVQLNNKKYRIHKLVFLMHHGYTAEVVDHINSNRTDSRIENLREADLFKNQHNRKINKNNSSGIKGVSWNARSKKWMARIKHQNKDHHIGYFFDLKDAAQAVMEARKKLHGEFANHG